MEDKIYCKHCGREIFFITSLGSGKSIPVDPTPIKFWRSRGGKSFVYTRSGEQIRCYLSGNEAFCDGYAYTPHFGTCAGSRTYKTPQKRPDKPAETEAMRKMREAREAERAKREAREARLAAQREETVRRLQAEREQYRLEGF